VVFLFYNNNQTVLVLVGFIGVVM